MYAPPDGYVDASGAFSPQRRGPNDVPVYRATLRPEDGLYWLPYMARQANGQAWEGDCAAPAAPIAQCRVPFYPDASRIFEEIDRFGLAESGLDSPLATKAVFDFYRPAPSGGYRNGLPAAQRTDVGSGDIPPEVNGQDFFLYRPVPPGHRTHRCRSWPASPTRSSARSPVGSTRARSGSRAARGSRRPPTG